MRLVSGSARWVGLHPCPPESYEFIERPELGWVTEPFWTVSEAPCHLKAVSLYQSLLWEWGGVGWTFQGQEKG